MLSYWVAYCVPTGIFGRQKCSQAFCYMAIPIRFPLNLHFAASLAPGVLKSFPISSLLLFLYQLAFILDFISRPRPRVYLSSPLSLSCPIVCTRTAHSKLLLYFASVTTDTRCPLHCESINSSLSSATRHCKYPLALSVRPLTPNRLRFSCSCISFIVCFPFFPPYLIVAWHILVLVYMGLHKDAAYVANRPISVSGEEAKRLKAK
jgi:hypothetical protein